MRGIAVVIALSSLILSSDAKLGESQRTLDPEDPNAKEHNSLQKNDKLDRQLKINKKLDEISFDLMIKVTDDSDHFRRLLPDFLKMDLQDYFFDQYGEKIEAVFTEDTTDRHLIGDEDPNSERELRRYLRFRGRVGCQTSRMFGCGSFARFRETGINRDRGRELKNGLGDVLENFGNDLTHIFTGIEGIETGL
jgi:hypothetical protein